MLDPAPDQKSAAAGIPGIFVTQRMCWINIPSGKHLHNYGKLHFLNEYINCKRH